MKRFLSLLISFVLLLSLSFNVSADEMDASLSVSCRTMESGSVSVFASITNIKNFDGITYIDYLIKYDPKILKLKKATVNMPDVWSAEAEDWSYEIKEGEYSWALFTVEAGEGITKDNQLFIELEFTPLVEKAETVISFQCIDIFGEDLFVPLNGKSLDMDISISRDSNDKVSVEGPNDISSVPDTESKPSSNTNSNTSNITDDSSPNGENSNHQVNSNDNNESNNLNEYISSNTSNEELNLKDDGEENKINITPIIIVSVILVLIAIGIVALFFIKSKKDNTVSKKGKK